MGVSISKQNVKYEMLPNYMAQTQFQKKYNDSVRTVNKIRNDVQNIVNLYSPNLENITEHIQKSKKTEYVLCHIKISKYDYFYFTTDSCKGKIQLDVPSNIQHIAMFLKLLGYRFYDIARHLQSENLKIYFEIYGQNNGTTPHLKSKRDLLHISLTINTDT
jgi:hypothetical protein